MEAALSQAKHDLADLRLPDMDHGDRAWVTAAGLPIYVALFGRDTLTAGWQAALASPQMMQGAHTGTLASLAYNPRTRYYGAATTSSFYPVVLSELWHWTGDKSAIQPLLEPALRALKWKDDYTDLFGDGFYDYKSRSQQGNENQGWKDSRDAIVYEDGRIVHPPISTCEEQAFVYVAKLRMSELLWFMGDRNLARGMFHEAGELKKRFNDRFWMPDKNFFALGLDSKRRQIKSIASNPGHLLACGIVHKDAALKVARRILQDDMFSGWGAHLVGGSPRLRSLQLSLRRGLARRARQFRHGHDAVWIDRGVAHHRACDVRGQHFVRLQSAPGMFQWTCARP